jgi:hypothetical protein
MAEQEKKLVEELTRIAQEQTILAEGNATAARAAEESLVLLFFVFVFCLLVV